MCREPAGQWMKASRRPVFQNDMSRKSKRVPDGQRKGSSLDNSFIHSFIPQLFIYWGCCVPKVKPSTVKVRLERWMGSRRPSRAGRRAQALPREPRTASGGFGHETP